MKGTIAFANAQGSYSRRYAVLTEHGDYTMFELMHGAPMIVGQGITGDFSRIEPAIYCDDSGNEFRVMPEDVHRSLSIAKAWVAGMT
jgi:hypothetical protein